jgi:hypothetical protein
MTEVVVELRAVVDEEDEPRQLWWYGEWGLEGGSSGFEHSTPNLAELVGLVVGSAQRGQRIRWVILDDEGGLDDIGVESVSAAVAQTGVTLPQAG